MATSSNQVPPIITSLPQEIKDLIADECELADLPTLRLIDRGLDTSGKQILGKRCMQTRTHIYTVDSLTELEKITSDPDLAKHIQKIVLVSQKYTDPYEDKPFIGSIPAWKSFFNTELPSPEEGKVVFAVSQSPEEEGSQPWGCQRLQDRVRATGIYETNFEEWCKHRGPEGVLEALLNASITEQSPFHELDARYGASAAHCHNHLTSRFRFRSDPATHMQPAWVALKSLKLDFGRQTRHWTQDCWAHFRDFISTAPNLEKSA
ncbi:hypothetical protein LTR27_006211 [Elasticomyces elasticus]|nr:hypothetical protein LTR27_006211 [Elasticomyces elasticus]